MIRFLLSFSLILILSCGIVRGDDNPDVPTAHAARIIDDGKRTRFVADFSAKIGVSVFTLANPYRVVIDLPEIAFAFAPQSGEWRRGLISAFRFGRIAPGKSRIVLDTTGPVRIGAADVADPTGDRPARLAVDLVPTDRTTFLRKAASIRPPERSDPPEKAPVVADRPTVVIDPGHGGIDPGALGAEGTPEKTFTLAMAKALKGKLERSGRVRVLLTREDDRFVPLAERVRLARDSRASLFLSLHADSIRAEGVRGATVYILSEEASDAGAAALAEKENRADVAAGFDPSETDDVIEDILTDLTRRETHSLSAAAAKTVVEMLKGTARLNKNAFRAAGFRVLRAPDVPSILLELGYLSSREDAQLLASETWRERTAAALAQALESAVSRTTAFRP